jgi:hypothetical protein
MILGAGCYQVPLIRKAKQMGLETCVVSIPGDYPGIPLSDYFLALDTRDRAAILHAAREHKVNAVVTSATDVGIPALERV